MGCYNCAFFRDCTPREMIMDDVCLFVDLKDCNDECYQPVRGEYIWGELSYNRRFDTLFNYLPDVDYNIKSLGVNY